MGKNHDSAPRLSGMWVSLSEAFAWISTRDAAFAMGLAHTSPVKLSVALIKHCIDAGRRPKSEIDEAKTSLLSMLRHAEVLARGRFGNLFEGIEASREIAADRWAFMIFGENGRRFRAQSEDGQTPEFWHDLLVRSDQLLAAFPGHRQAVALDNNDSAEASETTSMMVEPNPLLPSLREPDGEALGPPRPTSKEIAEAEFTRWLETTLYHDGKPSADGRPTQRSLKKRKDKIYDGLRGPSDRRMKDHLRTLSQPYTHIDWKLTGPARSSE